MSLGVAIETDEAQALQGDVDRSLLIVDDDTRFAERLARALERRGFEPVTAYSVKDGKEAASINPPAFAVVDLRLEDGNGLDVVTALTEARSNS
ncbi:MAG: response regulator, partial [Pseudomonadota bacterium]|nr:response regulator [Pseudomonadota bacterium]